MPRQDYKRDLGKGLDRTAQGIDNIASKSVERFSRHTHQVEEYNKNVDVTKRNLKRQRTQATIRGVATLAGAAAGFGISGAAAGATAGSIAKGGLLGAQIGGLAGEGAVTLDAYGKGDISAAHALLNLGGAALGFTPMFVGIGKDGGAKELAGIPQKNDGDVGSIGG